MAFGSTAPVRGGDAFWRRAAPRSLLCRVPLRRERLLPAQGTPRARRFLDRARTHRYDVVVRRGTRRDREAPPGGGVHLARAGGDRRAPRAGRRMSTPFLLGALVVARGKPRPGSSIGPACCSAPHRGDRSTPALGGYRRSLLLVSNRRDGRL